MNFFMCCFLNIFLGTALFAQDFVVGTTSAYAPFVSLDDEGKYVGFDIEVAELLAEKLGRKLVLKDLGSMPTLILALKQDKIDALIWAVSITEERQKQMDMIYYQGEIVTSLPLLFWKTIPSDVTTIAEMAISSGVISVEAGSCQEAFLLTIPGLKLKQVDKVMDALLELKYGKSLATMIDPSLLPKFQKKFPEIKVLDIPLSAEEQFLGNGICLNKNNSELSAQVKTAISELRASGKIAELEKKWNLGSSEK